MNEIEIGRGHKKHYDGKLKDHEREITELKRRLTDYQAELDVSQQI